MGLVGFGLRGAGSVLSHNLLKLPPEVSLQFLSKTFRLLLGFRVRRVSSLGRLAPEQPELALDLATHLGRVAYATSDRFRKSDFPRLMARASG